MHARSLGTAQQLQQSVAASGPHSGNDAALLASKVEGQLGNKISLMFTVNDGPGSLSKILELFQKYEVNLSRIESRPQKRLVSMAVAGPTSIVHVGGAASFTRCPLTRLQVSQV